MSDLQKRRITLLDTMILATVPAVTIAWLRFMASFGDHPPYPFKKRGIALASIATSWLAIFTMLTLIPIRMLQPRPPLARLWRQPGWLACNAIVFVGATTLIQLIPSLMIGVRCVMPRQRDEILSGWLLDLTVSIGAGTGIAAATGWATLLLVGRWEPGKDWIDRAGMACGIWLMTAPIRILSLWLLGLY